MNPTFTMRDLLLEEFELAVRTTTKLIERVEAKDWTYGPHENMRTLLALVNHLVQVPSVDLAIMQEKSAAEIDSLQDEELFSQDPVILIQTMQQGFQSLKEYISRMPESEFIEKSTKAFYFGADSQGYTQAKWLIEITTHVYHHRAQFFTYLKQLGYAVSMFDLY